jgi:NADH-quinone oxidoreductase subunit L
VKFPLATLGVLSVVAGVLNMGVLKEYIGDENLFLHEWLDGATLDGELGALSAHHYADHLPYESADLSPIVPGVVAFVLAIAGLGFAWYLYRGADPDPHMERLGGLRTLLMNNYYQDEYQVWLASGVTLPIARAADTLDRSVIDGIINGIGSVSVAIGKRFRRLQTGVVTNYAALLVLGLLFLVVVFGLVGGWF